VALTPMRGVFERVRAVCLSVVLVMCTTLRTPQLHQFRTIRRRREIRFSRARAPPRPMLGENLIACGACLRRPWPRPRTPPPLPPVLQLLDTRDVDTHRLYGLYLPTVILTVIWYSITHSLSLSRLKTFLLYKSFPL